MFFDNDVWFNRNFNYWTADFAYHYDSRNVYEYLNKYNTIADVEEECDNWTCEWSECPEEDRWESGEDCWMENCNNSVYPSCSDEVCKIWHATEYNYEFREWIWDIEDCEQDVFGQLEDFA